jgi:hypothetical protein
MVYFLGDMNYDTNVCGFYQSTYLSSFWSQKLIERQFIEQSEFTQSVVILVDSVKLVKGI